MQEFGLIELFKPKSSWYRLSTEEKAAFFEKVNNSIKRAEAAGGKLHGPYRCRWSTGWEMFAFWEAPSLEAVQDLAQDAEEIGWFEYFEQTNIIGAKGTPEEYSERAVRV
jgi:hypothetical protein